MAISIGQDLFSNFGRFLCEKHASVSVSIFVVLIWDDFNMERGLSFQTFISIVQERLKFVDDCSMRSKGRTDMTLNDQAPAEATIKKNRKAIRINPVSR